MEMQKLALFYKEKRIFAPFKSHNSMKYDVFISYSRKDTAIADQICAAFDKAGISYFIDRQEIVGGGEFPEILADAILESRFFLFLASNNSYSSKFTKKEIFFAFKEKPSGTLFPYIIDDSELPKALKLVFSDINILSINTHPIETRLVDDVLLLLGRTRSKTENPPQFTQQAETVNSNNEINNELELLVERRDGKWGFIDKQSKTIIPFEYDHAFSFSEGFACVKKDNKYGFINKQGIVVIPIEYNFACDFSQGLACVQKNFNCGFIDKNNNTVIPFEYDPVDFGLFSIIWPDGFRRVLNRARTFHEELALMIKKSKYGFIDKKGNTIIPFVYDDASIFSEGLAAVKLNNKYGFINREGQTVIAFDYDKVGDYESGKAEVTIFNKNIFGKDQTFYIDKQGNRID